MQHSEERSPSESYFWPIVWAVGLHVLIFGTLFVSVSMTPELPPSRPIIQATLYQAKSQSQATTQTNQKIAGEAAKTAAPQYETEQLEQQRAEQQKIAQAKAAAAKAAAQKEADAKAAEQKAAEQKKAEEARKAQEAEAAAKAEAAKEAEAEAAEQKRLADVARKKAAEEAEKQKAAEEAKKKAAEEAKKKAAAEAERKKAAEDAKKKAAAEQEAKKKAAAAEAAKKKKASEEAAARKAAEDKKAQALADLLSDDTERQQALADTQGDQVSGNMDDLIRMRAAEGWSRPPSARNNMSVSLRVNMLPDGTITNVSIARSSGDGPFDNSAVSAVRNIGRITEMQQLSAADFAPYRSFLITFTPEDLAL